MRSQRLQLTHDECMTASDTVSDTILSLRRLVSDRVPHAAGIMSDRICDIVAHFTVLVHKCLAIGQIVLA